VHYALLSHYLPKSMLTGCQNDCRSILLCENILAEGIPTRRAKTVTAGATRQGRADIYPMKPAA